LGIDPSPQDAAEVADCIINEKYQPWLTEVGREMIAQQVHHSPRQKPSRGRRGGAGGLSR